MADSTAYGVVGAHSMPTSTGGGAILKTTDIRVSDDIDRAQKEDPGAVTRMW